MESVNRQWRVASYPTGLPGPDNFTLVESPLPEPGPGQLLVRAIYLDVAPYMRARMSAQKSYASGVAIGDVMVGGGIGEVVRSNHGDYRAGDIVVTDFGFGWQEYAALSPSVVRRIDPAVAPLPCWLDVLGLNGITAYFALLDTGSMTPGDTVVVSAAAGSVGQIAGQIAKLGGCRAVGIAGGADKIAWCRELGYDDAIDYKSEADLVAAVTRACPKGVDLFLDNTAGPIHDAVMQNLAPHARIVVVGTVSLAAKLGQPDIGPRFLRNILVARARVQGFLYLDYATRYEEARRRLAEWCRVGRLRSRFDIAEGFDRMPDAFIGILHGRNIGKQLVRVRPEP
jgi:NADPH-dependent curcumin reductase CurA